MDKLYPGIVEKINKELKKLNLKFSSQNFEEAIKSKKRFFRIFGKKEGKKIFFKSLLRKEKGIKNRFLNEINFLIIIKENKNHPLFPLVPKILDFSTSKNFPYLTYQFLAGKTRTSSQKYEKWELEKIVEVLKIISSSPKEIFKFIPKKSKFTFSFFKRKIGNLLIKNKIGKNIQEKIKKLIEKNRDIINRNYLVLSHGDFSEANLVFWKGKVKIIDWEHIYLRNPLFDFADFWIKRSSFPNEQAFLKKKFFENFKEKELADNFFKISLIEICLRDLLIFNRALKEGKKDFEKQIKKYLKLIKNII